MDRRSFVNLAAAVPLAVVGTRRPSPSSSTYTGVHAEGEGVDAAAGGDRDPGPSQAGGPTEGRREPGLVTLFLCGDVMTGRGIDQVLPHPGDPRLYEPYARSATRYVHLAEAKNGAIPAPVDYAYPWGDALAELDRVAPDARIINLETSVTTSGRPWPGKGIHYRMHPDNVPCIAAASVDCCVLANNHVIDWGYEGLRETLRALGMTGIQTAGAGLDADGAKAPATLEVGEGRRVHVFAFGTETSGIPRDWAARSDRAGVNLLQDLSPSTVAPIADRVAATKADGDIVVASIHWGSNWGYAVPAAQREFAHRLIEEAGADVVHGHSAHHFKGIEVHQGRLILYGCGDFLSDYEGISGHEAYRSDLALLYFPVFEASVGSLSRLSISPMRMQRFRLGRASEDAVEWIRDTLSREGERFGTWVETGSAGDLHLRWN